MTEIIENFVISIFGDNVILATILLAMIPLFELKGAIPFAMSKEIWGENALTGLEAFLWSFLGTCIVVSILAILYKPLINWLKRTKLFRKLAEDFDSHVKNKSHKMENKSSYLKKGLLVMLFVAVPLPLTGVWTGTCIAVILGFSYLQTVSSTLLGNYFAGVIVMLIGTLLKDMEIYLLYFMMIVILLIILFGVFKLIKNKKDKNFGKN